MENKNFITTTDVDTKNQLVKLGFQLINESSNSWTFLNCTDKNKLLFNSVDNKKIIYTNLLSI